MAFPKRAKTNNKTTAGAWTLAAPVGALAMLACGPLLQGQTVLRGPGGTPGLAGGDLSVLELKEPRTDLTCTVLPIKPVLGFDLRFHSGYDLMIPLKELAGMENLLTVVFRVIPESQPESATYLIQKIRVPRIEEDAKGDAYLQGAFDLGEGRYKVEWLVRDRAERYCAQFWDVEAGLAQKEKSLALELTSGQVAASAPDQFNAEPPVERQPGDSPVNVKVLVNFAPQNAYAASLQPTDTIALTTMLRHIQRDPRISRFSVVAFNLQEQRVLYRQDALDRIDMPALGAALKDLQLGKVSIEALANKHAETDFLSELIRSEFKAGEQPDALIFAGPRAPVTEKLPDESLRAVGELDYPVFYMNYTLNPQLNPWRDSISHAVRFFRGEEFTVSRPRDLWNAVTEMVSKIVKSKAGRRAARAVLP